MSKERVVYGIGETVLDIIFKNDEPQGAKAGGSVLNSMVTLGRLGANVEFISETGNDQVGDLIKRFLQKNSVHTDYVYSFASGKSAISLAFLDDKNDAHYHFYKEYPNQRLQGSVPLFTQEDLFMFGSFYGVSPVLRPAMKQFIEAAKAAHTLVYYDPNFRATHLHEIDQLRPYIMENIQYADIVRGSDEDFKNILGVSKPQEVYNLVKTLSPTLIITENSKGVHFFHHDEYMHFVTPRIQPISTIGAGDTFNAGIIYGLLKNNINTQTIEYCSIETWKTIIQTAIEFATNVCQSLDNYIETDLAEKHKL